MTPLIYHLVQHMAPGGIETLVAEFTRRAGGLTSRIISLDGNSADLIAQWPRLAELPHETLIGCAKPPGVSPRLLARLVRLFRQTRPQAVLSHGPGPLLYGTLAARLAGVPIRLHTDHDGWSLTQPGLAGLHRLAVRLGQPKLIAVSDDVARTVQALHPDRTVQVIGNGIDTGRFRPGDRLAARWAAGLPVTVPLIGSLGRLERVKGHDVLLAALAHLPGVHLALIGRGSQSEPLRSQAQFLGISDRVHFLGHRDDTDRLLPAFDVFCLPSRAEGLPVAILEAQATGLPVVASDVGGVARGLAPGCGRLVPPEQPQALATALKEQLHIDRLAPGLAARTFIEQHFSLGAMVDAYRRLILP